MSTVEVALAKESYDVRIEPGLVRRAGEQLSPYARAGRILVVSDDRVWANLGERLTGALAPIEAVPILVPPGEGSKSWSELGRLCNRLLELRVERGDHLIAFGGGVVGDLAGFAAAILNRGMGFVQVPTSLLAQVDSSVGGKTGINMAAGKNLVGAFHQPELVLIDPECLQTLEPRQFRAGLAEIVKYALIEDRIFFEWLERHWQALLSGNRQAIGHAIETSVRGKAKIVGRDPLETLGTRALLNFGHTFGHALEAATGCSERLLHGEAVAVGMILALELSVERGHCPADHLDRARSLLAAIGLPVSLRQAGVAATASELVGLMAADKKAARGRIPFILSRGLGHAHVADDVALAEVEALLDSKVRA